MAEAAQVMTPQQRSQMLKQFVMQIWGPMQQQAGQQGVFMDYPELFEKIGRLDDDPDYADILSLQDPIKPESPQGSPQSPQPNQPTEHVRVNVPQRTQAGNDMLQSNALMGIDSGGAGSQNGQLQEMHQ